MRRPEKIYYDPEIRELPGPDSSNSEQAPEALERPLMDQAPPAPFEANKNDGQGKKAEDLQGIGKDQGKKKTSSDLKEKAPDAAAS